MKKYLYIVVASLSIVTLIAFKKHQQVVSNHEHTSIIANMEEERIDSLMAQGEGVMQRLTTNTAYSDLRVANIRLAPKSYTSWQTMPGGHMIIVTAGEGYYQSKGKKIVKIRKGSRIETVPGLYHWLGSSPSSKLEYISITNKKATNIINSHENVTKEEYLDAEHAASVK